ncbi:pyridoxal phosphatase [Uliginosibacterium gangwonense]|uniref:pyridoxal phosphatase n=1 Tax=Uliginosibacterium gangwonense TaxID=392736 RepID=UPI0003644104|nr:pyridoxal phosphatase [Uliginosibacterium gangwonense]
MNTMQKPVLPDFRLVALDLDGTLLDAQLGIHPETQTALRQVRSRGLQVMLITGRHHITTAPYIAQLELDAPAICCNGTYIYDFKQRRTLFAKPLDTAQASGLLSLLRKHGLRGFIYADDQIAYEQRDIQIQRLLDWGAKQTPAIEGITAVESLESFVSQAKNVWKMIVSPQDPVVYQQFSIEVTQKLGLEFEQSGRNWFDVAQKGNSKGSTLAYWLSVQGIAPSQVLAFGDNHNDIGMLKLAGMGIAMGNAVPAVQAHANEVIGHHDSNTIALALQRYVLALR